MMILNILLLTSLWAAPNSGDPNMAAQGADASQGGLPCAPFMQCPPAGATEVGLDRNTNPSRDSKQDTKEAVN
jgi:hypothetical protein